MAVIVAGGLGVALHIAVVMVLTNAHYHDFGRFYYSAQAAAGGGMYAPTLATASRISDTTVLHYLNMNPPHFQALLWPLTLMPIGLAYAVWTVVNIAIAVVSVRAIAHTLHRRVSIAWVVVALLAAPVLTTTFTGQLSGIMLGLLTVVWREVRADRWHRAAVALGVACSLKFFLAPLAIYLALRRRWSACVVAIVVGLACFACGWLAYGTQAYLDWIHALRTVSWLWVPINGSVYGPLARLGAASSFAAGELPVVLPLTMWVGHVLAGVIVVVGLGVAARETDNDRALLVLTTSCILACPLGWVYYALMLLPFIWSCWTDRGIRIGVCLALAGWMVPYFFLRNLGSGLFTLTAGAIYTWSMLSIWSTALASSLRQDAVCPRHVVSEVSLRDLSGS